MSDAATDILNLTIADYDRIVDGDKSDRDYELIDGELVMMTNPSEGHERIVGHLGAPLKLAMDKRGCKTYLGGMAVRASADTSSRDKYRPDILVRCGPRDDRNLTVTDPVAVVEVLSPSTMDYDRGKKLELYKLMPTLQHIVLVYSDERRVESYARNEGEWARSALIGRDERLTLSSLSFELALSAIYFDTDLA